MPTESTVKEGPASSRPPVQKISAPPLSLPSGGGAVRGLGETFESQQFTGAAKMSIPIPVPDAREVSLGLELGYSSGAGNGPFGMGFDLSLSSFVRKTSDGIPRYDDRDVFIFSDDGELTPALVWDRAKQDWVLDQRFEPAETPEWKVQVYRPTNEGSFSTIEQWSGLKDGISYWRVLTRDNKELRFGETDSARIFDPKRPERIFEWLIEESRDARGNRIRYHYKAEDGAGISESGRDHQTNRYISRIEYGNYFVDGEERFAFQVVFDYGEFTLTDPEGPPGSWVVRPDPFSSYRSGFEIRTLRRCDNILVYHSFHDQFDGKPYLASAVRFVYESSQPTALSFIKSVTETGFRRKSDGSYESKSLPPLTFNYSVFEPTKQEFRTLQVEGSDTLPGELKQGSYLMVDLNGEGLPGILYSDGATTLAWDPQGNGRYAGPRAVTEFPIDRDLRDPQLTITSVEGNGEPDLLLRSQSRSGFYEFAGEGKWKPLQVFKSVPSDITNPDAELLDVDGDGRSDLLIFENDQIRSYESKGLEGYDAPEVVEKRPDFPAIESGSEEELLTFADVFGDGLSHRLRIRNGMVECWPNLGYGHFGERVTLENAPLFQTLDASRVLLADLDGSGPEDLIYVTDDQIRIYFNQNGNSFSEPVTIELPAPFDELSRISFADVNGNGTSCLILTRLSPVVTHYYYDFAGDLKPYLLTEISNNHGAHTRVEYTTSVKQYLEDKQAGRPWVTRLYFPVQVVETVENLDEVSNSRFVTRHKYHDGYYDPVDREFRGFGFIETWDTEEFADIVPNPPFAPDLYVPPVYMRTWYHTGAFLDATAIARQYESEFWKGDPQQHQLAGSVISPEIYEDLDPQIVREGFSALAGRMIRQEIYGLDGSADEGNPYNVSDSNTLVRLVQPRRKSQSASFFAYTREALTYNYERVPSDPRTQHDFTLIVDDFGNANRVCTVFYPRRETRAVVIPEQKSLKVVATEEAFINHVESESEPYRWIGVLYESRDFQVEGLPQATYFSFDEIARRIELALKNPLAYGQPFTPGQLQARLYSWTRIYEWNEDQNGVLDLGLISSHGLQHHSEQAVFTPEVCTSAFGDKLGAAEFSQQAGYWLDQGYWWNRGLIQYFFKDPEEFFLMRQVDGAFPGVDPEGNLNPTTTLDYDPYKLLPVRSTQYIKGQPVSPVLETVVLTTSVENDYQALRPWRLVDANENVTEVMIDPLGLVIVRAEYGIEDGEPVGDEPLTQYSLLPASFSDVVNNPANYLQKATTYFYYDLDAWSERREPSAQVTLQRFTFVHDLPPDTGTQIRLNITFTDGFSRTVEDKLETVAGPVPERERGGRFVRDELGKVVHQTAERRWITSGLTIYNNKGLPAEEYLPWFSASPYFEPQPQAESLPPPTRYHYDALERLIRTDTPKGFFSKAEFFPWELKAFDEDDTVKDSHFYQEFFSHPITPDRENEADALTKAAKFFNTPSISVLDNMGLTVRGIENNLGAVGPDNLKSIVEGSNITPRELWDQLVAKGYLKPEAPESDEAWVTSVVQPYDPEFRKVFDSQFPEFGTPLLDLLKNNGLITLHELDIAGNQVRATDPRLFYTNVTQGTDYRNVTYAYDMIGNVLVTNSADQGLTLSLVNIFADLYWNYSARNFEQIISYDRLQRRSEVRVKAFKDGQPVSDNLVEVFTYGELQTDPTNFNLRGRLYELKDQSGIVINSRYSLQGDLQRTKRQFTTDYKNSINWGVDVPLDSEIYQTESSYNALRQLVSEITPDGSKTINTYNQAAQLRAVEVEFNDGGTQQIVEQIEYNANDRRLSVSYGNGVLTTYGYEATTTRLLTVNTVRVGPLGAVLQDISYTYDPVGNITRRFDSTYQTVFHNNQQVTPLCSYTYDALYRLLIANGRQHPGITSATYRNNEVDGDFKQSKYFPLPNDSNALENYSEFYSYDDAGNLLNTKHQASNSWTYRREIMPDSNRLKTFGAQNGITYSYPIAYDNSGNQTQLNINNSVNLFWNCCENLVSARVIERPDQPDDADYYTYDNDEMRTRKVSERLKNGSVIEKTITIYLGNYQTTLVRNDNQVSEKTILERQSLRVMDDDDCVAIIDYWEQDDREREASPGTRRFRFQLTDQLDSIAMEVDEAAALISYEEFFPYGGTAFIAGSDQREVAWKDYRYSGKECDDSTGLYYYGARYYAPWLGRWIKPDPLGSVDGLNLYAFVGGNPITYGDRIGLMKRKRPAFNANKTHASEEEYELETGKVPNPGADRTAAPHRLPYAAINNVTTALEQGKLTPSQFKTGMIDRLLSGSQTVRTNLSTPVPTDGPKQKKLRTSIVDRYKEGEDDVLNSWSTFTSSSTPQAADTLVQSLNNLPSNAPSYGPHQEWNTRVNQALHLNVHEDGSLSPRSDRALDIAADPIIGPHMGVARRVVLTQKDELPTPNGRAVSLSKLSKADRDRIKRAGTVKRASLKGGSHPKKRLDWTGPGTPG